MKTRWLLTSLLLWHAPAQAAGGACKARVSAFGDWLTQSETLRTQATRDTELDLVRLDGETTESPILAVSPQGATLMRGGRLIGSTDPPPLALHDSSAMAMHDFGRSAIQPLLHELPPGSDTLLLQLDDQLPAFMVAGTFLAMPSTLKRLGVIFTSPATTHLEPDLSVIAGKLGDTPSLGTYIHLLEEIWAPCPAGWEAQADIAQNPGDHAPVLDALKTCGCKVDLGAAKALHYKLYLEGLEQHTVRWVRLSSDTGHVFKPGDDRRWETMVPQLFSDPDATVTFQIAVSRPPPPPPPPPPPAPPPPPK